MYTRLRTAPGTLSARCVVCSQPACTLYRTHKPLPLPVIEPRFPSQACSPDITLTTQLQSVLRAQIKSFVINVVPSALNSDRGKGFFFPLLQNVQHDSAAHPAPYSKGTGVPSKTYSGGDVKLTTCLQRVPRLKMSAAIPLKVKLTLEQVTKAQRGRRGTAPLFL